MSINLFASAGATVTGGLITVFTAYIIVSLAYKNAQWPGSVVNMTLKEFKLAKAVIDDNNQNIIESELRMIKPLQLMGELP